MKYKKIIICMLIVIMVMQNICMASYLTVNKEISVSEEKFNTIKDGVVTAKVSQNGGSAGLTIARMFFVTVASVYSGMMYAYQNSSSIANALVIDSFTIENFCFNTQSVLNIDFFSYTDFGEDTIQYKIGKSIATWYSNLRNLSVAALLCVLIYIGIRMALSTTGSETSKYKKMLNSWVASMIILFVLQYIMIAMIQANNSLIKLIGYGKDGLIKSQKEKIIAQIEGNSSEDIFTTKAELAQRYKELETFEEYNFETVIVEQFIRGILTASFSTVFVNCVFFIMIVYYTIKFFIMYIRRMLTIGFLIVISPLITITYAIDKAGDNQAQAFSAWLKEFMINVFIQAIHALVYLVFIFTAIFIAAQAPLLAIIFFGLLSRAEKIARNIIFQKLGGSSTLGALGEIMPIKKS